MDLHPTASYHSEVMLLRLLDLARRVSSDVSDLLGTNKRESVIAGGGVPLLAICNAEDRQKHLPSRICILS